jgi:pimeloyl-ACP methyl ester carboxylesterase
MTKKKAPAPPLPFRLLFAIFPTLEKFALPIAKYFVVRLFFTPIRFTPRREESLAREKAKQHRWKIEDDETTFYQWGNSGPIVLLVHGWSGRGTQLRYFVEPLLQSGYTVVSFDAPGHGLSQGNRSTILKFKACIEQVEEKFGTIHQAIGHSLGGAALIYTIKEGLQLNKLVTISTPSIPEKIEAEFLKKINGTHKSGRAINGYVKQQTGKDFKYFSAEENIKHIAHIPMLCFHDFDDREAGMEHALAMQSNHPNLKLIQTSGLGHNRILKDKEVVSQTIEWLKTPELVAK